MDGYLYEPRKFLAPEVITGKGILSAAPRYIRNLGSNNVFIVTDSGLIKTGWVNHLTELLDDNNISYTVFSELTPNPKDYEVMKGAETFKKSRANMIIALGGGSPMDCAKGIGISVTNNKHVLEFEGVDEVPIPGPPLICIPTTAGTSADVSQFAIITDSERKTKIAIVSKTMVPDISIIDPELTTTMDKEISAETGLDALTHAFEAYVSNASSPLTNVNALESVKLISNNLRKVLTEPENYEARTHMVIGSLMAGFAFSNASLGIVHSMAHSLGGYSDLSHGLCNALLLEHSVEFNFEAAPKKYADLLFAMNSEYANSEYAYTDKQWKDQLNSNSFIKDSPIKDALIDELQKLRKDCGIGATLTHFNISKKDIPNLAERAHKDACLATNPKPVQQKDIEKIYEKLL